MQGVLPAITGLKVDGVIYQYTAVKNASDPMTVSVQNKDAIGPGYVFRSQDEWTGLRGNSIVKVVPVDNILVNRWGDGEISVTGQGSVKDASVLYKYRYDTCVDPLSSPSCPGYAEAMLKALALKDVEVNDPLTEEMRRNATENRAVCPPSQAVCIAQENTKLDSTRNKNEKEDVRRKSVTNSLLSVRDNQIASQLEKMNDIPEFKLYSISIPGGVYKDALRYPDKVLPDSRSARSLGLAQEKLHESLVNLQYNK